MKYPSSRFLTLTTMAHFCDVIPTTDDEGGVDEVSKFTFLDIDKNQIGKF